MILRTAAICFMMGAFITSLAHAQIEPGKETLVVDLPSEYRWKSKKIPKDTRGIRGTAYTVRGKAAREAPVKEVTVTTIDRRYYPMKAEGSPEEKWAYEQAGCPDAVLEVVDKKVADGRTAILYAIKSTKTPENACGSANLITYIAEGPTALHTVELNIPEAAFTPERYKKWCDALLQSHIE